jgi:hypothetical protein
MDKDGPLDKNGPWQERAAGAMLRPPLHHREGGDPVRPIEKLALGDASAETTRMTESIQKRREQRREFLLRLYMRVDGSISEFVHAYELGAELGIEEAEVRKIFEYLEEKRLVLVDDHRAGIVRLTAAGVDDVESRA